MHDLVHAESPVLSSPALTRPDQEMTPGIVEAETVAQVVVVTGSPARITSVNGPKVAAMPLPSQTPTASTAIAGFSDDTISKLLKLLPASSDEDDEDEEDED